MKYLKLALCFVQLLLGNLLAASSSLSIFLEVTSDAGAELFPHVRKISNDLYMAEMEGQKLYLVMERVDSSNIKLWKKYINIQSNSGVVESINRSLKGTTSDGSCHFKLVLDDVPYERNEIWVAYITSNNIPERIPNCINRYRVQDVEECKMRFAKDIKMFVTVVSSPNALITSHMGVAVSAEGVISGRPKAISVDLHSFAAKVMLLRNPARRFMINAPAYAMEKILADALPAGSVFIGTKEMQRRLLRIKDITYEEFIVENPSILEDSYQETKKYSEYHFRNIVSAANGIINCDENKNLSESEIRNLLVQKIDPDDLALLERHESGQFIVNENTKKNYMIQRFDESLHREFEDFKIPYGFSGKRSQWTSSLLKLMEDHPPLISVGAEDRMNESISIFDRIDSTEIWLNVEKNNPDYEWMFTEPFFPVTHFVAVDLHALANAR